MYHDIVDAGGEDGSGFPGRDAALYKITTQRFEEHLRALREVRGAPCDRQPAAHPAPRTAHPALTFDDGGASAMRAADALERYGFVGQFFVTTNYVGRRGFLNETQIRELHARGHVVGSHSCSHPLRMGHCTRPRIADEWRRSCGTLEDILGAAVRVASVPGGDFAPAVAETAAQAGITLLYTSEPSTTRRHACGLTLQGRFTIQRWMTADTVRGLAVGAWLPRARQAIVWNAKKLSKQIGGEQYLKIRRLLLGHGREVQWGDL